MAQSVVLADLGRQVRDVMKQNVDLRDESADLRQKVTTLEQQLEQTSRQQEWMDQSLQACQREKQDLQLKCSQLKDKVWWVLEENKEECKHDQLEEARRSGFYLSTIARKERTIMLLSNECNKLMDEITKLHNKQLEFERLYKSKLMEEVTQALKETTEECKHEQLEGAHPMGFYLSTIASKERTIMSLSNKCNTLKDEITKLHNKHQEFKRLYESKLKEEVARALEEKTEECKHEQQEEARRKAFYLSTIASKERTIVSLSDECNTLKDEITTLRNRHQEFEKMYKESCAAAEDLSAQINHLQRNMDDQHQHTLELGKLLSSERHKRLEAERLRLLEKRMRRAQVQSLCEAVSAAHKLIQEPSQLQQSNTAAVTNTSSTPHTYRVETVDETCQTSSSSSSSSTQTPQCEPLRAPIALMWPLFPTPEKAEPAQRPAVQASDSSVGELAPQTVNTSCSPGPVVFQETINDLQEERLSLPSSSSSSSINTNNCIPTFLSSGFDLLMDISETLKSTLTDEFMPFTAVEGAVSGEWQTLEEHQPQGEQRLSTRGGGRDDVPAPRNEVIDMTNAVEEASDKCPADLLGVDEKLADPALEESSTSGSPPHNIIIMS